MVPPNEDPIVPDPKAPNAPPPGDPPEVDEEKAAFSRLKNDLAEERKRRKQLEDEVNAKKAQELKDQNQWKEYAEKRDQENQELRSQLDGMKKSRMQNAKIDAVLKAANALGLRSEAVSDLEAMDFKDVMVEETSTGRYIVTGAKIAAEKLKASKGHWFTDPTKPTINGKDPKVIVPDSEGQVTIEELNKLSAEAKKTGNYKPYEEKLRLFKAQTNKK